MTKDKERKSMRIRFRARGVVAGALAVYTAVSALALHAQQNSKPTVQPTSLRALAVPEPPNLGDFVQNKPAAIALGKALFWEQQASSDNQLACASCHFHAGADNRVKNALNPDLLNADLKVNGTFDPLAPAPGHRGGANYTLKASDFPFHQLANPNDRDSVVLFDSNDVVSSAGVYNSEYGANVGVLEKQRYAPDGVFQVGPVATRRVEPRNTPTVINAALNFRNFWDGRANFVFNGVNPWGPRDEKARIWLSDAARNGTMTAVPYIARIPFASAASQAVGPALSAFEMSGSGRQFADIGHKLLATRPLLSQSIAANDSVLGKYRSPYGMGLNTTYDAMIKAAFWPQYLGSAGRDLQDRLGHELSPDRDELLAVLGIGDPALRGDVDLRRFPVRPLRGRRPCSIDRAGAARAGDLHQRPWQVRELPQGRRVHRRVDADDARQRRRRHERRRTD